MDGEFMKLCIFPNDPLIAYVEKGEIKDRYFNPENIFDEIHVISFIEQDANEDQIQKMVGLAKIKIHCVGKIKIQDRKKHQKRILELIKEINPDIIRAFNVRLEGWFAAVCAKNLRIPLFVSLHTQYDYNRRLLKKSNFRRFLISKFMEKTIESFVLENADKITIVFQIIEPYVRSHCDKKPVLLYNKVNIEQFNDGKILKEFSKPLILSVGNLIKIKNHECIIRAMKNLDAYCLIIGKGEDQDRLEKIIKDEKLEKKIQIINTVPHEIIQDYYKTADIFALAYDSELEGLPIPIIEALAAGLPVVIPHPKKGYSDGLEDSVIFCQQNPQSFHDNMKKILDDEILRSELSRKAKLKSKDFAQEKIEKREAKIYLELNKNPTKD